MVEAFSFSAVCAKGSLALVRLQKGQICFSLWCKWWLDWICVSRPHQPICTSCCGNHIDNYERSWCSFPMWRHVCSGFAVASAETRALYQSVVVQRERFTSWSTLQPSPMVMSSGLVNKRMRTLIHVAIMSFLYKVMAPPNKLKSSDIRRV